jgi:hypothetical protein
VSNVRYVAFQTSEVAIPRNSSPTSCDSSPNCDRSRAGRVVHVRLSIVIRSLQTMGELRRDGRKRAIPGRSARS